METTKAFEGWCLLEIMGHNKYAGYLSEQSIGGTAFVRIDVPEVPATPASRIYSSQDAIPAYTKLFGASSVYCISPVSEEFAKVAAADFRSRPHSVYSPQLYPPAEEQYPIVPAITRRRVLSAGPPEDEEQEDPFSHE